MKIRVETTDALYELLGGQEAVDLELADGASPHDALGALNIAIDAGYLLIVNEAIVPKAQRNEHVLVGGDVLQILPPLKGG